MEPYGLSMGFSRQEYWSRLPFPSPGDLPNPGIKPRVSHTADSHHMVAQMAAQSFVELVKNVTLVEHFLCMTFTISYSPSFNSILSATTYFL